jgi:cytochrome P450
VFGPSISTASPEDWARHRKVLATPFMNESIMRNVWDESIRQTQQMLESWDALGILSSVAADTRTLSLNVLAAIGFQQVFDFRGSQKAKASEEVGGLSYRDSLMIVLDNVILIMLIPRKYLTYSWLPAWMRRIGLAGNEFQRHMEGMVEEEMKSLAQCENSSSNLISSLVRALDTHQKDRTKGMSIEEIYGNLFVINFAGHDTTANTLAFALLLLVAYPEVQDWVGEELYQVIKSTAGDELESWDYRVLFPKLVRCRSIMVSFSNLYLKHDTDKSYTA